MSKDPATGFHSRLNFRADYWKSQGRKFCDFCKCWIADNKPSIDFHEGGKKHKENVSKRLKEIYKNTAKQAKLDKKFEDDLKRMESAAMAAYLKDVENNTRDMTADKIIKEKLNKSDKKDSANGASVAPPMAVMTAAETTIPRFKAPAKVVPQEVDPCDPTSLSRSLSPAQPRIQQGNANKAQGKSKPGKGKGKGKKTREDDRPSQPIPRKLWCEAASPEGYIYYWHVETNESVWEPPEEGYMTIQEQEEEAKEQALQAELLDQWEKEEVVEKADIFEEQRANAEREKLKEIKQVREERKKKDKGDNDQNEVTDEEERPYLRDYSVPEKPEPYGSWQVVRSREQKSVDLQLPQPKQIQLPTFENVEPPPPQKTFKEKTVTSIETGDSDNEGAPTTFKKRKISHRNVRRRTDDD